MQLILNGDAHVIPFFLASSTDHVTGVTGATPVVTLSKNGASFAAPAGAIAEIGNGWYVLTPSGADTATNGILLLHATATGADVTDVKNQVVAFSPYDANALGLARIDAAVSSRQASGNVTVGAYASGQDPATLVWNALTASFDTANTFGAYIQSISGGTANVQAALTAQGYTTVRAAKLDNIDAAVSSRMATFTVPANFAALSINGSGDVYLASTEHVAIGSDVQTGLTAQGFTTARATKLDDLDAAVSSRMAASSAPTNFAALAITTGGAVTAGTVSDKTGYSLTQTFPANFAALAINTGGAMTVGTNGDKTGYALTQGFPANFANLAIDGSGDVTIGSTSGTSLVTAISTAILSTPLTEAYAVNGAAATLSQLLYEIAAPVENVSQTGTNLIAYKRDGVTQAMRFSLDNATTPTTRLRIA